MTSPPSRTPRGSAWVRSPRPGPPEELRGGPVLAPGLLSLYSRAFRLRDAFCGVLGAMALLLLPGLSGVRLVTGVVLVCLALGYIVTLRLVLRREGRVLRSMAWVDQVFAAWFLLAWPDLLAPAMVAGILDLAIAAVMIDRKAALRGAAVGGALFCTVVLFNAAGDLSPTLLAAPAYAISAFTTAYAVGTVATRERSGRRQLSGLLESLDVVVYEMDAETLRVLYVSPHITDLLGRPTEDYLGDPTAFLEPVHRRDLALLLSMVADLNSGRRRHDLEYRMYTTGGELRWVRNLASTEAAPGERTLIRGTITDITRQKAAELALAFQAGTDGLTGLPNRASLLEMIAAAPPRLGAQLLVFLDLDSFKRINDSLGHRAGDTLLVQVAERLRQALRTDDVIGRMGGDEFVVLSRLERTQDASAVVARVLGAFRRPFELDGRSVGVTASAGAVLIPAGAADQPGTLLEEADLAMYSAKRAGPGRHAFYTPSMRAVAREQLDVESALSTALEQGQFHLVYQPIVRSCDREVVGYEGLVRWVHPVRGVISPADFIGVAEQTGQVVELGRWVVREACAEARRWLDAGDPVRTIAVNLSARQLTDDSLVEDVAAALRAARLSPSALCLEITETALIDNPDAALTALTALRATGVTVALDDFGTGYSSLSHLHQYPVDVVKIDRSFVAGVSDGADRGIITAILHLSHHMGLVVVAEGVETMEQADELTSLGCNFLQGYALGRPARSLEPSGPRLQLQTLCAQADLVGRLW